MKIASTGENEIKQYKLVFLVSKILIWNENIKYKTIKRIVISLQKNIHMESCEISMFLHVTGNVTDISDDLNW